MAREASWGTGRVGTGAPELYHLFQSSNAPGAGGHCLNRISHERIDTMPKYPNTVEFNALNRPVRLEAAIRNLDVEGTIPREIEGAFFRAVPDPAHPPLFDDDIALSGRRHGEPLPDRRRPRRL